ncbi:hypothetical protein HAX54_024201, partial [Datura stramonium]|nr:hypothetical protein [Datura stramonium]
MVSFENLESKIPGWTQCDQAPGSVDDARQNTSRDGCSTTTVADHSRDLQVTVIKSFHERPSKPNV